MTNGRCRVHGGKTPSGPASPHWKTGKHSRVLRELTLSARYEEFLANPELGELREEVALTDLHIEKVVPLALGNELLIKPLPKPASPRRCSIHRRSLQSPGSDRAPSE